MALQFNNDDSLRAQRMTADEARSVIDLWQQEQTEQFGLTDKPAVPDVAEGLDLPVEDVQRLLQEVRTRRAEEERALAQEQEIARIRLAEQDRQLAELRREQAEWRRQMAFHRQVRGVRPSNYRSGGHGFGLALVIFFWMAFVYWIVVISSAYRSSLPQPTGTIYPQEASPERSHASRHDSKGLLPKHGTYDHAR